MAKRMSKVGGKAVAADGMAARDAILLCHDAAGRPLKPWFKRTVTILTDPSQGTFLSHHFNL